MEMPKRHRDYEAKDAREFDSKANDTPKKDLAARNVDVDAKDETDNTLMALAALGRQLDVMKDLDDRNSNVETKDDVKDDVDPKTPPRRMVLCTCRGGHPEVVPKRPRYNNGISVCRCCGGKVAMTPGTC